MFSKDIGIDLGTANVLIHVKGRGVVLDEPSVVTLESDTKRVLAVGEQARRMVGRTPGNIITIRPLRDGVIADFEITEMMLKYFIDRVGGRSWYARPRILICAPTNITSVEQKSIREAAERSGAKEVFMEEEPKAAAIGAGMDIYQPSGNMVVDIGGGTTDVAVLSMGDVVTASSIKVAGDKFDEAILRYIKQKYKLLIGERTAEDIKVTIGTVRPGLMQAEMDIRGRDMVSGLPQTLTITSGEVKEALWDPVSSIVAAAKSVLERTPPELSADIIDRGVVLTGGGALLNGLDELLSEELHVPVWIAEDPMHCVVKGTGIMLDNLDKVVKKKF
ncbi:MULTISPECIES: rod shape-determining protein [Paenibacillus]|jgi:rod shape-determining protein MreB|uniref:Cell shape-determining protein MreB n=1 Tax=Paenibacillus odorifer TaxID=189426 RepID=A0A1R0WT31_9BACL|nr:MULTISPECIES: rod shape-determining protein [Paenibacillus]AIQ76873.1 rod shape-determining protein MreB [Paenibacillus odorifer]AWV36149.1 rod shape-determining protein [Paenibacillus odorifer]ETT60667.1 MreB/Mrl family cell shape determining protein [Paenibacillus sp. FSL H8-237]MDH6428726.1 rod shape-determining protein MreB [Paenibacillus sp. PastH-4]MDH6444928.1 rod shape-determining protein MreB [Paenibacillus sp. PastF-4]